MIAASPEVLAKPLEREVPELSASLSHLVECEKLFCQSLSPLSTIGYPLLRGILGRSQRRLKSHSHDWQNREMTLSYLSGRRSLCFHSNVCYLLENDPTTTDGCWRAAQLIHRALAFRQMVRQGLLPIEREKSVQLDQSYYPFFFGCTRLPGLGRDRIQVTTDSQHFVVACRGKVFIVTGVTGVPSHGELYAYLKEISAESFSQTDSPALGLWTTLPRDEWADVRLKLCQDPDQAKQIELIETAIFWVALDLDKTPETAEESIRLLSIDSYVNRWFDRSHQLIVFGNGVAGLNRDHTLLDGHPNLFYAEYLTGHRGFPPEIKEQAVTLGQRSLEFRLLETPIPPTMTREYEKALDLWEKTRKAFAVHQWDDALVNQKMCRIHRVSADFAIQAAIHLSCYRYFGTWQSASEAVHMRHTVGGRYDSILTLTPTLKRFVLNMIAAEDNGLDAKVSEALATDFIAAQNSHRKLIRECKEGASPMLHMQALMQSAGGSKFLSVSRDGVKLLGCPFWRPKGLISAAFCNVTTSHPGSRPGVAMVGFTDTEPDVVGIAYLVKEEGTRFFLKGDHSKQDAAPKLVQHLKISLQSIAKVIVKMPCHF